MTRSRSHSSNILRMRLFPTPHCIYSSEARSIDLNAGGRLRPRKSWRLKRLPCPDDHSSSTLVIAQQSTRRELAVGACGCGWIEQEWDIIIESLRFIRSGSGICLNRPWTETGFVWRQGRSPSRYRCGWLAGGTLKRYGLLLHKPIRRLLNAWSLRIFPN